MSPIIYLFCKYPLTIILNFKFHQIVFLPYIHPCMGSLAIPYLGHPLEMSDCWLVFWFLSRFLLDKNFWPLLVIWWRLQNSWVLVWNRTLLSLILIFQEMNSLFFYNNLKCLVQNFPILFAESSAPFHSLCACLIR